MYCALATLIIGELNLAESDRSTARQFWNIALIAVNVAFLLRQTVLRQLLTK